MFGGFRESKIKPQLKMAVHRLQIASNKKIAQIKNQKRDISKLLAEKPNPKEEKARIRAEALIREDSTVEAYEILQLNCELLAERIKLVAAEKTCPIDLKSVVSTLIWASARVDVAELVEVRRQLKSKYGKKFEEVALQGDAVNERVLAKLSIEPPPALLVQTYLERIAEEFNVDWKPKMPLLPEDMSLPARAPTGHSVPVALASGYGDSYVVPQPTDFVPEPDAPLLLPPRVPDRNLPGAHSVSGPPPPPKPDLPMAHVGTPIAPPFVEEESSSSSEQEEENEYIPDTPNFDIPSAPSRNIPNNTRNNQSNGSQKDDDNDDDDDDEDDDGDNTDSFRNLEARFADLKK